MTENGFLELLKRFRDEKIEVYLRTVGYSTSSIYGIIIDANEDYVQVRTELGRKQFDAFVRTSYIDMVSKEAIE